MSDLKIIARVQATDVPVRDESGRKIGTATIDGERIEATITDEHAAGAAMKIDLDELEHDCRGAPVAACPADHPMMMPSHACATTTLALIARIRELENMLFDWGDPGIDNPPGRLEVKALLEKGAVLP